ncbi:hypothetical protein BC629DRAFT_1589640 [Irpex lacteus]|nr:hypothetical protein BC629DRAFT_1589640 [Irpex lacteus]
MAPIRLGVIGLSAKGGWASAELIPPIFDPLLTDKYTLTALCTSTPQSAAEASSKYSQQAGRTVKAYHGTQGQVDIAKDPEVDMVVVSVKVPDHYAAVLPAIEAGKMVFVEWAPGKNLDETVRIAEAVKAKGLRTLVGTQSIHAAYARKVKEIIDSGKIGKVLSTTLSGTIALLGKAIPPAYTYMYSLENGTTLLTILTGHFLAVLKEVLGELTEVSAFGAIREPTTHILDPTTGQTLPETITKTSHDQVIVNGTLKGRTPDFDGIVVNIHYQGGISVDEPFRWVIYGEKGVIEVKVAKGAPGDAVATHEKDVYLNGEKVDVGESDVEKRIGNIGKGWLEFAKGKDGTYESLESIVGVYRVVDAALTSVREGRKIVL